MNFSELVNLLADRKAGAVSLDRSGPGTVARLAAALMERGRGVVVVAKNQGELHDLRSLLALFNSREDEKGGGSGEDGACPFIVMPENRPGVGGKTGAAEQMAALFALENRRRGQGVLTLPGAFLLRQPPLDLFAGHSLSLVKGMEMSPELVLEQAVDWGYARAAMVSVPGEIAMRGDILDVFSPGFDKPVRLEFFGDFLEDLRLFDPLSQRSTGELREMHLLPATPVTVDGALRKEAEAWWKRLVKEGRLTSAHLAGYRHALDSGGSGLFAGTYYERASNLEDWLPDDPVYILPERARLEESLDECRAAFEAFLERDAETRGLIQPHDLALRGADEVLGLFDGVSRVVRNDLAVGNVLALGEFGGLAEQADQGEAGGAGAESPDLSGPSRSGSSRSLLPVVLPERGYGSFQDLFPDPKSGERPWHHLVSFIKSWPAQVGRLVLSFSSERSRKRFLQLAGQDGIHPRTGFSEDSKGIFALVSGFRRGIELSWENTLILGEDVIQPRVERAGRVPKGAFQGLDRYDALREGDYLVHRDYGVARFGGLLSMDLGGARNDYLLLYYAGEDKLYLPVDRLSLIQRFKGGEGVAPAPDKLGGTAWIGSKEKAKKAIERIAADLVEMYALRKVVKGFSYLPVGEMYREFEASFGFEETPDQARAIEDVLADMEKPEPMDRLVCGDVGFGKTEVALRAAFRAAAEGRQVAMLCPTTILAEQHYQTFRTRLAGFAVNVGMLSRFVSKAKQKETLELTAKGQIDILIGTHRILSKDVVTPNLGLLILDEEQRFGVRHKERLKEMRKNVDVLTLTATPIPRTLQLSLSGIRELSVIETPPPERKPVATALLERDDATLKSIVERELARKGQVFWVYNRVQGLERVVEYVKKLAPEARVGMAHGQMSEHALEESVRSFWQGETDVLVSTAIIESGLDFPRANTMIVDQAQLFGLGQLYQLRGRVGRSDRQAFAIFVTPDPDRLPDIARQRMRIILELDYLGAGFQIAMEDLRLRGAGNILGESQTGHMNRIGLDLFLEMLEEAVAKVKGGETSPHVETEMTIGVPAFIPESYMQDRQERLRYYKLLSSSADGQAQEEAEAEIRDRYGPFPAQLRNFSAVLAFKRVLPGYGVRKADIFADKVRLAFADNSPIEPAALVAYVAAQKTGGRGVRLTPPAVLELPLSLPGASPCGPPPAAARPKDGEKRNADAAVCLNYEEPLEEARLVLERLLADSRVLSGQ